MGELSKIQVLAVAILPVLFAITVHEVAHGWVAKRLGDPTAQMLGRLTLNPIKHIDPVGTVLLPLFLIWMSLPVIGWAKPVPITWENLRHPKRDVGLVAVAGPASNLVMALFWALVMKIGLIMAPYNDYFGVPFIFMGFAGIYVNGLLMVLNMIPLPPLDGGRVLTSLLPGPWAYKVGRLEPYGMFILIFLLISGVLGAILLPPFFLYLGGIGWLFDIQGQLMQLLNFFFGR